MSSPNNALRFVSVLVPCITLSLLLNGCGRSDDSGDSGGSGGSGGSGSSTTQYTVGGTVSGLSTAGLVLQNNGGDDLPVSGSTFEFATALGDGSSYVVTVLTQPTGLNCTVGNGSAVINAADITDVTVTCRKWKSSGLIESGDTGDAQFPQVAIDGDGNALAVWHQWDGTYFSIYANRYVAGSGWVGAELIENNTGDAQYPQIAIDADGNALAVWQQDSGGGVQSIYANRYVVTGTGWDNTAAELIEDGTGDASYPQIAFDADGNAIAVWYQWGTSADDVWANRYVAGTGWDSAAAEIIDSGTGNAWHPQITFDSNGNAIAVWQQYIGGRYSIYANRYTAVGDAWGASAELIESDDTGDAWYPQIAIDGDGNALAVWQQDYGPSPDIWANSYINGSGWDNAAAERIENASNAAYVPQVAFDSNGNALAVWHQSDGTRSNIMANRYVAGTGWDNTAAEAIESGAYNAFYPQIAFDGNDNAMAVWQQSDNSIYSIWANRYSADGGWDNTAAELIESDDTGSAQNAQIAVNSDGDAVAVWEQQDSVNRYNIQANNYE